MTLARSENAKLEFSEDGTAYHDLPYVGGISVSGGEAPETDVVSFEATGKLVGRPRIPSLSIEVASYVPQHDVWSKIVGAARNAKVLWCRLTTFERNVWEGGAGDTLAIATTGIVTFGGTATPDLTTSEFGVGMVIDDGSDRYTIDRISSAGVATVAPAPASAVATSDYDIVNPSLRLGPFRVQVRSAGNFELPSEGNLTSTLELAPLAHLPLWEVVD